MTLSGTFYDSWQEERWAHTAVCLGQALLVRTPISWGAALFSPPQPGLQWTQVRGSSSGRKAALGKTKTNSALYPMALEHPWLHWVRRS